jgi:N-acetylmuramic acid 6-phosphate etherase
LRHLSGRSGEEVQDALARAGGNIKIAMLILQGCAVDQAAALLDQAGGRLRTALRLADNVPTAVPNPTGEK